MERQRSSLSLVFTRTENPYPSGNYPRSQLTSFLSFQFHCLKRLLVTYLELFLSIRNSTFTVIFVEPKPSQSRLLSIGNQAALHHRVMSITFYHLNIHFSVSPNTQKTANVAKGSSRGFKSSSLGGSAARIVLEIG